MQSATASQLRGIDLKAERVRAGLTQLELATRLGVSTTRIANVEGAYRPPATIVERFLAALVARPDAGSPEPN
jgi:transcriptional regulator with XRE-family HTH domain